MIETKLMTPLTNSDYKNYFKNGVSYEGYKTNLSVDLATNTDEEKVGFISLNQSRMKRVDKTFQITEELARLLQNIKDKVYWLMISEHWCGDASQNIPSFNKIAELSAGKIELRIVYRDENTELMDQHLTNSTRSIPKLIQLDEAYNVTGIWGSRPVEAQELIIKLKSNPLTADTYVNELHLWYARNKQIALQGEIVNLLK